MNAALADFLRRLEPSEIRGTVLALGGKNPYLSVAASLRAAGLLYCGAWLVVVHLLEKSLLLASWACIGAGALSGRFDPGWLTAWALALASSLPLHAAATWLQGVLGVGLGGLLKERLLSGAMSVDADVIRGKGSARLMSEVLETEAIDELGASGGVATLLAAVELAIAPLLFLRGAAGGAEILAVIGWGALSAAVFACNLRRRAEWTLQRMALNERLIENMTADRTRAVQQAPREWQAADDAALGRYVTLSRQCDAGTARIEAALPRGYVIVGVAALTPAFLAGSPNLADLAITLGTILYIAASFERLCGGYSRLAAAWVAWRIVQPIVAAAGRPAPSPAPAVPGARAEPGAQAEPDERGAIRLHAYEVGFVHPKRHHPVLRGCTLSVARGDRILLQGPSGSGKSTLAAILAGARAPSDGFVLAAGLDRQTLGDAAWRRRVALAPQYHENHIIGGSLLFNLLLARDYPHSAADIREAEAICRELGLGELLDRMPAGLRQRVGDAGWRLSQGERSRIYMARALLQRADVILLDETLAALDPQSLRQCLECVLRRAPSLIVIAHP
jgi:ATP-binding cassette subfamily B protein